MVAGLNRRQLSFDSNFLAALLLLTTIVQAAAAEPEANKRTIRVRTIGTDDRPLPDVKIHVAIWSDEPQRGARDFTTDQKGQVTLDLPDSLRILRLWATREGYAGLFVSWGPPEFDKDPVPGEFVFRLAAGTVMSGVVRNEDGEPIAGVQVEAQLVVPSTTPFEPPVRPMPTTWLSERPTAIRTDAQGRWKLTNVPEGEKTEVKLLLSHPDYVSETEWGSLQTEQNVSREELLKGTAKLTMSRGIRVTGKVLGSDLKPVKDAVVIWGGDPYLTWGSQEVTTDAEGNYSLPPLPSRTTMITVIAPGWAPQEKTVRITPERSKIDFQLEKGKTVRIRFMDRNGQHVPDVSVSIASWHEAKAMYNHRHPNVVDTKIPRVADKDGLYEWTWAPNDEVVYQFHKNGRTVIDPKTRRLLAAPLAPSDKEHTVLVD